MTIFVLFLMFLGAGADVAFGTGGPVMTMLALIVGLGSAWGTYLAGDRAVLASSSAQPLAELLASATTDDDRFRYRQYQNVVEEVAISAGVPTPTTYVIPDPDPNAFATGRDPAHASIAVTEGLLRTLNREELQGVVAHEMGHVRNLDIRLMMIVAALVGGVVLLADWSGRWMWWGGGRGRSRRDSNDSGALGIVLIVVWVIAMILAPIIAQLLAMSVSRTRESQADATGAELTRNPLGLASALRKIDNAVAPTTMIKRSAANLCIADPLGRPVNEREGRWASLMATHPPMAKRIAALEAMAYASGPRP